MRSTHVAWPAIVASAVLSTGLIAGLRVDAQQKPSDKPARIKERELPPQVRETYKVFRAKCGKCHTTERVLRAKYDKQEEWHECIARMAKLPGANINPKDQEQVKEFFAYYLKHLRAPQPANGADAPEQQGEKGEKGEPKQKERGA